MRAVPGKSKAHSQYTGLGLLGTRYGEAGRLYFDEEQEVQ